MMYLDLSELDRVFTKAWSWSYKCPALAWLRRKDFIGDPRDSIEVSVRKKIEDDTGKVFSGSIRMLANLRYFGFQMNPIVCYYCFNGKEQLQYVVAEVTNTPWREKHAYVLECDTNNGEQRIKFDKLMHVSPFNDLNFIYEWIGEKPKNALNMRLINWRGSERLFDATLALKREEITSSSLWRIIIFYPLMTVKVFLAIYWQASKLYLKGIPFVNHSGNSEKVGKKKQQCYQKRYD